LERSNVEGESTSFIEFMLESIDASIAEYLDRYRKSDRKSIQKSDRKILELMGEDGKITIKELALRLRMSESGIKKIIRKLKNEGRLRRVGGAKGGTWHPVSDAS